MGRDVKEFRPLPFLGNPHVQTLIGTIWKGAGNPVSSRVRYVLLPDGDRLVLHDSQPPGWRPGGKIVLLVHGLSGSHQSGYMLRLTSLLLPHGIRVVRMDLRGCGRGEALARQTYNGACSPDVRAALLEIRRWDPMAKLLVVGFSLGGNIALKLAGESADDAVPGLAGIAAVGPPIDLERCAALLALPRNRFYDRHFAKALVRQVRRQRRHFPDLPRVSFPQDLTLRDFDEIYTAPRGGFESALDYYRRAASLPLIERIQVPTYLLTARDDPFIAVESFESTKWPSHIQVEIARHGGHLGFLGWDGFGGIRWADRRLLQWIHRF